MSPAKDAKSLTRNKADAANPHLKKLRDRVNKAPKDPGIYRWMSEKGEVLYVGKAKNLKNRLQSYVQEKPDKTIGPWKLSLRSKIADLDFTVTDNEIEALILETNLIKELKPKYNVLMKDDKNYVYVRISLQDPFPSVQVVRQMRDDGATYFGPYLSSFHTKRTLEALNDAFPYQAAAKTLDTLNRKAAKGEPVDEAIFEHPTLEQQIGKHCNLGLGTFAQAEYRAAIEKVVRFLKGERTEAKAALAKSMQNAAENKKFEKAGKLRDVLQYIQSLEDQQIVSDTSLANVDYIGVALQSDKALVVLMQERGGKLIADFQFALSGQPENEAEVIAQFLPQYYSGTEDIPDAVMVGEGFSESELIEEWLYELRGKKVQLHVPERGKKSKLLLMAERNAREKVQQQLAKWEAASKNIETALAELKELLSLPEIPKRIEGYDISHFAGSETVGSMVVVRNGKAANDQYRNFTIRTLSQGDVDDYASLREVLKRRLLHLVHNIKLEEERWKAKQGITFGKARKAEQEQIEQIAKENEGRIGTDAINYKDYIVARKEEQLIAFVRIFVYPNKLRQIRSLWVQEDERGGKLGQILVRMLLSKEKKDKIYITALPGLESYYEEIGFRIIRSIPSVIQERMDAHKKEHPNAKPATVMVYIPSENKADVSLESRPDLLVIDGGKGQLSTVAAVLRELSLQIPVIGLAKREEEVFRVGSKDPVVFPKDSQGKFLLMRLRDEAHRAANLHREKRGTKAVTHSALDDVPGIGSTLKKRLLREFGSVSGVRQASDRELQLLLTARQIAAIREHLTD